jgi:hypothetical protein
MGIRILTRNAVENTNIDGARQNHFNSGMQSGIVKGAFAEGNIFTPALNVIAIDSCELRISGHQVVIDSAEYITLNDKPYDATRLSLIAQIKVTEFSEPEFELIVQPENVKLIEDNLFENEIGSGIYQLKLCNFTLGTDGVIRHVIRVVDIITGGTSSATQTDIEFTATATELSASSQPEAVITYNHETGTYDLVLGIPRGGGTDVQVGGISQGILKFDSDPQKQLDILNAKIGTASSFRVEIVDKLPTENISTSTFYLVKTKSDGENIYNEYLYVNGVWETLGTTSIEAYDDTELKRLIESKANKSDLENLSNALASKVDKTTFDTETARLQGGIKDNTDEILEIQNREANYITKDVDNLSNYTKTADLSKVAISNSYKDLDDKPIIPDKLPTPNKLTLKVDGVTKAEFDGSEAKTFNVELPNTDSIVDAVNNQNEIIAELEQDIVANTTALGTKLDKVNTTVASGISQVYGVDENGQQTMIRVSPLASSLTYGAVVQRKSNGHISIPTTPTVDGDATSKSYVDTQDKAVREYVDEEIDRVEGLIAQGSGTSVTIGGTDKPPVATLNFSSDPQTQINSLNGALYDMKVVFKNNIDANASDIDKLETDKADRTEIPKLYDSVGTNTDGAMTQRAVYENVYEVLDYNFGEALKEKADNGDVIVNSNSANTIISAPANFITYSGSIVTVKAGTKVVIPNGLNSDGSCNNLVYTLPTNATFNISGYTGYDQRYIAIQKDGSLITLMSPNGVSDYRVYMQYTKPNMDKQFGRWFDLTNNVWKTTGDSGATWTELYCCPVGLIILDSTGNNISALYPLNAPTDFSLSPISRMYTQIVSSETKREISMCPSSNLIDISSIFNKTAVGTYRYTAPDNGYVTIGCQLFGSGEVYFKNTNCGLYNSKKNYWNDTNWSIWTDIWIPCAKGDVIELTIVNVALGNIYTQRFIKAKGV